MGFHEPCVDLNTFHLLPIESYCMLLLICKEVACQEEQFPLTDNRDMGHVKSHTFSKLAETKSMTMPTTFPLQCGPPKRCPRHWSGSDSLYGTLYVWVYQVYEKATRSEEHRDDVEGCSLHTPTCPCLSHVRVIREKKLLSRLFLIMRSVKRAPYIVCFLLWDNRI